MVNLSLPFDVACNPILISVVSYRAGVIPVSPEFSTPKLFLHLRALLEYLPGGEDLDGRDNPRHTVRCDRLDDEMHAISGPISRNFIWYRFSTDGLLETSYDSVHRDEVLILG